MSDPHEFLRTLVLVLCVAAGATIVFQRLRQPVVFGYLVAGMILGPHVPIPLVADEGMVRVLSELGVILLMFALGLEFSLRKLFAVGPTASVIAVLQTSAMVAIGYLAGQAFGWTQLESVYAGAIIAISSTTIIVKAFAEQGIRERFTQVVFGVLIMEDLIAIFLLAILTAVSGSGGVSAGDLA
ncbi:MAG TPA: cation:proton antiporter, partial [Thermoanaerobaculia bacterium]|nr:cation:proton antiporter [Thermoanaerobaculia bacterium]